MESGVLKKINNKLYSFMQKKDEYDDVINKYLQKINDQRRNLLILREEAIEVTNNSRSQSKMFRLHLK